MSKIAAVEVIPVAAPGQACNDLDGTVDTVIVRLTDEAGRTGIGETDAPPAVVKSFLGRPTAHLWSRNAGEILLGADPVETAALWQKLYEGTFWPGRRGLDEGWGSTRVEVWGWRGQARESMVYGLIDRTAIAAGTVLAVTAARLADT